MSPATSKSVLITGASKGIGEATALHLDALGFRVYAGVRREADGEALRARASGDLRPVFLDVTDPDSIAEAVDRVSRESLQGLAGLVNNAGIVVAGPVEVLPLEAIREQFEVNFFGVLSVIRAFLPLLRKAQGRIVNVSSINGRLVTPFAVPYSASKFALEALSDGLRMELRPWKIQVSVIQPGAVATPIWKVSLDRAKKNLEKASPERRELYQKVIDALARRSGEPPKHAIPSERVARKIAHALTARRPKVRYLVGRDARIGALVAALVPQRLQDRLLTR